MNKHVVFQLAVAATIALVLWLMPMDAEAQRTVRCRWPWQPAKIRMVDGSYGWTCIYVWEAK